MRAKEQLKQTLNDLKNGAVEAELNTSSSCNAGDRQTQHTTPRILSTVCTPRQLHVHAILHIFVISSSDIPYSNLTG